MNTDFDYKSFPTTFMHCFNEQCLRGGQCLRRQMALCIPKERGSVIVVNPGHIGSLTGEDCPSFLLDQPQRFARGFSHLFDNVPHRKALAIKSQMLTYFGRTSFYRCYRKERLIKPGEQKRIGEMFRNQNLNEEPQFDEYVDYYDLG